MTNTKSSAPLLSRVKSWQLIGNLQGGCFAATMTLASRDPRRYRKAASVSAIQWIQGLPTEHPNQTLAQVLQRQEFFVETSRPEGKEMGFGVRAVKTWRTMVFETSRWQEPIINLAHTEKTEANRKKSSPMSPIS